METVVLYVGLILLGLVFGSFAGAMVWRLRALQLAEDKKAGEKVDEKEYKQLQKVSRKKGKEDRSRCLHCGHVLAWYDLLPIVSWVSLRGKCRYCHAPIGTMEPLIEIAVALFLVLSFVLWPQPLHTFADQAQLMLWLLAGVGLAILFVYDMRWFLLPNRVVFPLMGIAAASALLHVVLAAEWQVALLSLAEGVAILAGLYFVLYIISSGRWIGFGDIKLNLVLGLLLADWQLAFLTLFVANVLGCLYVIPGMVSGKLKRDSRVPFGPFLIIGCVIAMLVGHGIVDWFNHGIFVF